MSNSEAFLASFAMKLATGLIGCQADNDYLTGSAARSALLSGLNYLATSGLLVAIVKKPELATAIVTGGTISVVITTYLGSVDLKKRKGGSELLQRE